MIKAIFSDRDGVINSDRPDYVKNVSELNIYPFFPSSVKDFNGLGFSVFVISNQQGVGKGIYTMEDVKGIEREIRAAAEKEGGVITDFRYCTHLEREKCGCRKPKAGMILDLAEKYDIDLSKSFVIGDSVRDMGAAKAAGVRSILVFSGSTTPEAAEKMTPKPDFTAENIKEAVLLVKTLDRTSRNTC